MVDRRWKAAEAMSHTSRSGKPSSLWLLHTPASKSFSSLPHQTLPVCTKECMEICSPDFVSVEACTM